MNADLAIAAACVLLLLLLVAACSPKPGARDGFYTEHGQEEPTRSYVPYTGTLPFGAWDLGAERGPSPVGGHLPWAEAFPSAPHYYRSLWGPGATWV